MSMLCDFCHVKAFSPGFSAILNTCLLWTCSSCPRLVFIITGLLHGQRSSVSNDEKRQMTVAQLALGELDSKLLAALVDCNKLQDFLLWSWRASTGWLKIWKWNCLWSKCCSSEDGHLEELFAVYTLQALEVKMLPLLTILYCTCGRLTSPHQWQLAPWHVRLVGHKLPQVQECHPAANKKTTCKKYLTQIQGSHIFVCNPVATNPPY